MGCPECISDGFIFIHDRGDPEKCTHCDGAGVFPANFNRLETINNKLKRIEDGNRDKYELSH